MISIANSKAAAQTDLLISSFERTSDLAELLPNVPAHLAFVFEKAPEPSAEAEAHYDTFRRAFLQELKPRTMIEAIWTKDVLTYTWEAHQLRVYRDHILKQAEVEAVCDLIEPSLRDGDPMGLRAFEEPSVNAQAVAWQTGQEGERAARVDAILAERGLTADSVRAHAFFKRLPTMDALNQMIQTAEQRRDGFLRELDRKRSSYANKLRAVTDDVIDLDAERVS
ncbi:hypothetical protein FMGBMHLM_1823 [Methylobacterium aerolatum]|nr:hypothetical protein FMGBMHLM_1823 [Methylobacterium aerolatum]